MKMTPEQKGAATALLSKMGTVSAIPLMREYQNAYGVSLDWHEFSDFLDQLATRKIVRRVGFDKFGHHQYQLVQE